MSRTLSATALAALFAQETGEAILFLVEIDHSDWGSPVRLVNNTVDIVSNSDTYSAFPFEASMPNEVPNMLPKTRLRICNVDRQIIALLRALSTAPTVEVSIVLGSTPDTIEAGPFAFELEGYTYDQFVVQGTLGYEDVLNEPFPAGTFNPADFPGLF